MSDTSQGAGWWQASNDKWYAPEEHPEFVPPPSSLSAPVANHQVVEPRPAAQSQYPPSAPAATATPSTLQWVMIGAGSVGTLGTLITWITASAGFISVSRSGISTSDGKLALVIALVALAASLVRVWRPSRAVSITAVVFFGLLFILGIYEVIHISSKSYSADGITITATVGIGIYLCLLGGLAGAVAWIVEQ